jgi:hypothetical protein
VTETSAPRPPAGWYPDGAGQQRYWDGDTWTDHVAPLTPAEHQPATDPATGAAARPAETADSSALAASIASTPQPAMAGVAQGLQMKHRNVIAVWIGLPLITLGIYLFVWYYKIHREMAEYDPRRKTPVAGPMLVLLLLGWTVIAPCISFHNAGVRVRDRQQAAGLVPSCSPALSWLLFFVLGLNTLYLQSELNKVVEANPGVPEGTPVALHV